MDENIHTFPTDDEKTNQIIRTIKSKLSDFFYKAICGDNCEDDNTNTNQYGVEWLKL